MRKINYIDLFAGCGGLSDGFEQTRQYKTIACVEWEKEPCNTLIKRLEDRWSYSNANEIVLRFDIQRTNELINGWYSDPNFGTSSGLSHLVKKYAQNKVDLIIGGPPCQAYSLAGRIRDKNGMHDDYRNYLFESYLKVVSFYKPHVFIFENVPGMLSAKPGGISIVDRITKAFSKAGYLISSDLKSDALFDCSNYGVPQVRKRLIILGINKKTIKADANQALYDFYKNIVPKYSTKPITVSEAIGDLPKIFPVNKQAISKGGVKSHYIKSRKNLPNHEPRSHSVRDINTFRLLCEDIESGKYLYTTVDSLKKLYFNLTGRNSNIHKYHVLRRDKPSNTIPAHLYKDGLRHIHPDSTQARTITVREAARLQSFDDDYIFTGSMGEQYKMIGNAVPPQFARVIASALSDFMKNYFKHAL